MGIEEKLPSGVLLTSVEQLGAFRSAQHNLVNGTAPPEPVKVAEMTA